MAAKTGQPWWKEGVIYQIYPRSFLDTNGDGVGDLPGILAKLDYLNDGTPSSLGIDAIWLSPVYSSPEYDFGYDISDYKRINPLLGSMEDLERLIAEAHRRGIRIIMDLVLNHTSYLHDWFQESRSSRQSPRRDWYVWQNGRGFWNRPPNNWKSFFGGSAWQWDRLTRQYFLHVFLQEQPDLNWRNPQVKEAMFDVARFWLEKGVDGFRLDAINWLVEESGLKDNPHGFWCRPDDLKIHLHDKDQPETHALLKKLRGLLDNYHCLAIGETCPEEPAKVAEYYGREQDELHMAFNFNFLESPWQAKSFRKAVEDWETALGQGGWPNYVLSNHDQVRHFSRYNRRGLGHARAKVAAVMLLTLRGTPFLYYGEEIGMPNVWIPPWRLRDPVGKRSWPLRPGRDGERTPMLWDDSPNGGFTTGKPWLPAGKTYHFRNVAREKTDPDSVFNLYRRLIWLRKECPALLHGSYRSLTGSIPEDCFVYLREHRDQTVLVALNFSAKGRSFHLKNLGKTGKLLISTDRERPERYGLGLGPGPLELGPNEACLVEL